MNLIATNILLAVPQRNRRVRFDEVYRCQELPIFLDYANPEKVVTNKIDPLDDDVMVVTTRVYTRDSDVTKKKLFVVSGGNAELEIVKQF